MAILYTRTQEVKNRLQGKVKFTTEESSTTAMTEQLLNRLIAEAESHVEFDLSPRYATPFICQDAKPFSGLPERPTKEIIRTLCELQSVIRVLETDFGTGSTVDSKNYSKNVQERYDTMMKQLMSRRSEDEGQNQFKYPPLPGLEMAYFNHADNGWRGMVLSTNDKAGGMAYPSMRINDPMDSYTTVLYNDDEDII